MSSRGNFFNEITHQGDEEGKGEDLNLELEYNGQNVYFDSFASEVQQKEHKDSCKILPGESLIQYQDTMQFWHIMLEMPFKLKCQCFNTGKQKTKSQDTVSV